jgi:flagellar FliL protein
MTVAADPEIPPAKSSKMPLIIGLVLALAGGGGGFFAVQSGLIGGESDESHSATADHTESETFASVAYVALDPIVISIPTSNGPRFLRFAAQLEVSPEHQEEVALLKPRIIDVLNGYLRAVSLEELERPAILMRLRVQMLRRIQVVVGPNRVNDLLVMEFVVN